MSGAQLPSGRSRGGGNDQGRSPIVSAEERLLDGVIEATAHHGYTQLSVDRVLASASVSRATFYQYFSNVDDCFLTAYRRHAEQFTADVVAAARGTRHRELGLLGALVDVAVSRPAVSRVLMS